MTIPVEKEKLPPKSIFALNGFRRIQLALAGWGIVMLAGSILKPYLPDSANWGTIGMHWYWVGLTLAGLLINFWLTPEFLASGMLFRWVLVLALAFILSWLLFLILPLSFKQYASSLWHWAFAIGYIVTGYNMDRRLWWLAAWEVVVGLFMLAVGLNLINFPFITQNLGLTLGLTSGIPLLVAALPVWKQRFARV